MSRDLVAQEDVMQANAVRILVSAVAILAAGSIAYSTPPLARLTIAGGDLANTVSVTDSKILDLSNPWQGRIAIWSGGVEVPDRDRPVYDVTFEIRLHGSALKPIYRLKYVRGEGGNPDYVYLPGSGEPWYRQNVSTILREGRDGHWHAATPEWDAKIQEALGLGER